MSENSDSKCETGEKAISVSALTKKFNKITALEGVSFEVKKGEIFGMLGPDGAGKTTLMRILAGLMPFDRGRVSVLGRDLSKISGDLCDHIAYMPQRFGLYPDLSVIENIMFYADLYDMKRGRELDGRIDELLEFCRMSPFKNRFAGRLSGGMKQKLGLTCALIHTPALLFLDEPTNGLDPAGIQEMRELICALPKQFGMTVVVSSHLLSEIDQIADNVGVISNGELVFQGSLETLHERNKRSIAVRTLNNDAANKILKEQGVSCEVCEEFLLLPDIADDLVAQYISHLFERHIGVVRIEERQKSLEDIFLDLTGMAVSL